MLSKEDNQLIGEQDLAMTESMGSIYDRRTAAVQPRAAAFDKDEGVKAAMMAQG